MPISFSSGGTVDYAKIKEITSSETKKVVDALQPIADALKEQNELLKKLVDHKG